MSPHRGSRRGRRETPQLAEFLRIRRQLGQAVLALVLVTAVGVVGLALISRGNTRWLTRST